MLQVSRLSTTKGKGAPLTRGELRRASLCKAAAELFLERGYDDVSLDDIVELAGGSKSAVYTEFGGKAELFVSTVVGLLKEENSTISRLDFSGLDMKASLEKLAFGILKLITSERTVKLHRLAVSEAVKMPEIGKAWYTHGPSQTAGYVRDLLDQYQQELSTAGISTEVLAFILHDALTGNVLAKRLAGVGKSASDKELRSFAATVVDLVFGSFGHRFDQ